MTTVVIGHGRSPEGKGWGGTIDACDTVIRMWDWQWQHSRDYGDKYDYGLFVLTRRGLRIFSERNVRHPSRGWLAYIGKPTDGALPNRAVLVDTTRWVKLARKMGGLGLNGTLTLTRGCVAAAWAIERAKKERVVLVGFDNVCLGVNQPIEKSFCPEYWELNRTYWTDKAIEKKYPIGNAKTATHDMAVEKPLLDFLANRFKIELIYAQETWE